MLRTLPSSEQIKLAAVKTTAALIKGAYAHSKVGRAPTRTHATRAPYSLPHSTSKRSHSTPSPRPHPLQYSFGLTVAIAAVGIVFCTIPLSLSAVYVGELFTEVLQISNSTDNKYRAGPEHHSISRNMTLVIHRGFTLDTATWSGGHTRSYATPSL